MMLCRLTAFKSLFFFSRPPSLTPFVSLDLFGSLCIPSEIRIYFRCSISIMGRREKRSRAGRGRSSACMVKLQQSRLCVLK